MTRVRPGRESLNSLTEGFLECYRHGSLALPRSATRAIFPPSRSSRGVQRACRVSASMERFRALSTGARGVTPARDQAVLGVSTCVCANEKSRLPEKTAVFCLKGPGAPVTRREPVLRILLRSVCQTSESFTELSEGRRCREEQRHGVPCTAMPLQQRSVSPLSGRLMRQELRSGI